MTEPVEPRDVAPSTLIDGRPAYAGEIFSASVAEIDRYAELLRTTGIERGLLGPREAERVWDRHLVNSVALLDLLPTGAEVADIGSGAGLPGIPLALARPDLRVTLVEPLLRRSVFLNEVVDELRLGPRVEVIRSRAEDLHDRTWDVVCSRALAPLDRLVGWCLPLLRTDGAILALKGDRAAAEVADHSRWLTKRGLSADVLSVRAHPDAAPTSAVRVTHS